MRFPSPWALEADTYARWPVGLLLGAAGLAVTLATLFAENDFLCILSMIGLGLVLLAVGAISVVTALVATLRGFWRRALSLMAVPGVLALALFFPTFMVRPLFTAGEALHFQVQRPLYLARIKDLPDTGEPKLAVFVWDGWLSTSHGIVYDASDKVTLPPEHQSAAWRQRIENTELSCGYGVNEPLGSHFYSVGFAC